MNRTVAVICSSLVVGLVGAGCTVSTQPGPSRPYSPPPPDVEVRDHREPPPDVSPAPPPPPERPWDNTGWILLGEKSIDGHIDSDQFDFSQKQGKVSRIMMVASDGDFEVLSFKVVFVSGKEYDPQIKHYFREGSRTRPIDLPQTDILRAVQIKYHNLNHGEHARVQVWAR